METQEKIAAECQLNKTDDNSELAFHESGVLYFRPETEEIIVIPQEEAGDFEDHWRGLLVNVDDFHQANSAYSLALEQFGQQQPDVTPEIRDAQREAVVAAETQLEKKREALLEKLKEGESRNMGYQGVVELLPLLDTRKKGKNAQGLGRRYVYAEQRYFSERAGGKSQAGKKKTWHTVTLKNKDSATGKESIYTKNKKGKITIDTQKLRDQLSKDRLPALKAELKDHVNLDDINIDKTLFDWAECWNESVYGSTITDSGVDVSGAAQFMRFISNVGAEAEFNPNEGTAKIKGEAKSSLTLASGIANATFYIPDRMGWDLCYRPGPGDDHSVDASPGFNMGVIRLCLENQLIGFVGASAQIEGQLQVMVKDKKQQVVAGQPRGRLPPFAKRRDVSERGFYQKMDSGDEGAAVSGEIFAGASAEYSLKGTLQWLKPARPSAQDTATAPATVGAFTDFATIGASIAGLTGFGVGARFLCTFIKGKFCFKVAASLCCGAGAKGAFICEVGYQKLQEFGAWLAYQLYTLDYHFFNLIVKEAFETYSQLCVMLLSDIKHQIIDAMNNADTAYYTISDFFSGFQKSALEGIDASTRRNGLANNINAAPLVLLTYTPEAKGNLLYLLTRHGVWDHLDIHNRGDGFIPDIYHSRKKAIIHILSSIQTQREWVKVMMHRTADGQDLALSHSQDEAALVAWQEAELRTFLQEGMNRDDELDDIKARLRTEIAWGYALAMNHSWEYKLAQGRNPLFPRRGAFGPLNDQQALV